VKIVECYFEDCGEPVVGTKTNSKGAKFYVCDYHYQMLLNVFTPDDVQEKTFERVDEETV
jgi:hypothetical protein